MKKQNNYPITQIVTTPDSIRYAGIAEYRETIDVCCANGKEVEAAFREIFRQGDAVDVIIKKR